MVRNFMNWHILSGFISTWPCLLPNRKKKWVPSNEDFVVNEENTSLFKVHLTDVDVGG